MATLIQSKQIQGVVTASVVQGDFTVGGGGLVDLSAASGVTGSFSGSFTGDGSQLNFGGTGFVSGSSQISLLETDGFTAFSTSLDSRITTLENATDNTGSDTQILSISGDQLTISSGNTITIPTGSSGGGSNISLNSFTASYFNDSASFDTRIDGINASGSGANWNVNLSNIPTGLISGSIQILGGSDIISSSAQITSLGFVSESGDSTPAGTISGSEQITDLGFISSSDSTTSLNSYTASNDIKISNLEQTTSSLDTRITQLSNVTGSYETVGRGIISSSQQFPSGIVSGSSQISALGFVTSSGDNTPAGTISGSKQISDLGFISSSHTDISSLNTYIIK